MNSVTVQVKTPGLVQGLRLGPCLAFAAGAGLFVVPWLSMLGPVVGSAEAYASYFLVTVVASPVTVAPNLRRISGAILLTLLLLAPLFGLSVLRGVDPALALSWGVLVLSLVRSVVLVPGPARAALPREIVLGSLSSAAFLVMFDYDVVDAAFAFWSFWLVQSAVSLFGTSEETVQSEAEPEPSDFDAAYRAVEALLQEQGASANQKVTPKEKRASTTMG